MMSPPHLLRAMVGPLILRPQVTQKPLLHRSTLSTTLRHLARLLCGYYYTLSQILNCVMINSFRYCIGHSLSCLISVEFIVLRESKCCSEFFFLAVNHKQNYILF